MEKSLSTLIDTIDERYEWPSDELFDLVENDLNSAYAPRGLGIFEVDKESLTLVEGEFKDDIPYAAWQRYERRARPGNAAISPEKNCLFAPIHTNHTLKWLLVLGPKGSGDVYTTTDKGLIASLALEMSEKLEP